MWFLSRCQDLIGSLASTHSTFNLIGSCNKHPNIQRYKATKIHTLTPLTYELEKIAQQRDYAHQELQRTISIENKHTLDCFKNCGLLQLSTQTFAKNIIVNHSINGKNRRKSKGRRTKVKKKKQSAICSSVIGQNWSRGPCPTPPASPVPLHKFICEFTQQDGWKKRTAKRVCVTNVTGLLLACYVVILT